MILRLILEPSGTQSAATRPSSSFAGPENTLNSTSDIKSDKSTNSRGILKSGLSEPNLLIASAYVIRTKLFGRDTFITFLNNERSKFSIMSITSSSSTKLISISSCVNSGCRSARRSSSRKHRTI